MTPKELKNIRKESIQIIDNYCQQTKTSYTAFAIECKIHPAQLLKFVQGKQGLTDSTLSKIGGYIDKNTIK